MLRRLQTLLNLEICLGIDIHSISFLMYHGQILPTVSAFRQTRMPGRAWMRLNRL